MRTLKSKTIINTMRLYVKHCPEACPERRAILEEHLADRGFTDVKWITKYPVDHPFIQWLHKRLGQHLSPECISGLVKNLEACQDLADDPTLDGAMFCDDDAVFIKDWADKIVIPAGIPFVNMSIGVNFHLLPTGGLRHIQNNGGCEVIWMSKQFAQMVVNNTDGRSGIDHVYFGLIRHIGADLVCSPIAQQTSLLQPRKGSLPNISKYQPDDPWHVFVNKFKPTGLVYSDLWYESGIVR